MNRGKLLYISLFCIIILNSLQLLQAQEEALGEVSPAAPVETAPLPDTPLTTPATATEEYVKTEIKPVIEEEIQPIVQTDFSIKNLSWDTSNRVFAYLEKDTIYLRDAQSYRLIGTVNFSGVLDFAMYQEDPLNIQIIACSRDGTLAVWTLPIDTTDKGKEFLPVFLKNPLDIGGGGIEGCYRCSYL